MIAGPWFDGVLMVLAIASLVMFARGQRNSPGGNKEMRSWHRTPPDGGSIARWPWHYYATVARQAGFDSEKWRLRYWMLKLLLGAMPPLLALEMEAVRGLSAGALWPGLALMGGVGFMLPDGWLLARRRHRRRQVTRMLDYFLNLLVAFLQSGASLEQALRSAAKDGLPASHPLGRELALIVREMDAGREPAAAFHALSERTGVAAIQGIASALSSSMRLGTPIVVTLQTQADLAWTLRRETALKRINATAIMIMFPVMLCGFPVFLVVALFPLAVELVNLLIELATIL